MDVKTIFAYNYAILHSPTYRSRYAGLLKSDFPRLPLTNSPELFHSLAQLGQELIALHLLESPKLSEFITTYTGPANPEVGHVGWSDCTVWLNADKVVTRERYRATKAGSFGFTGVSENVWNFCIGSYQICHKWLKDRQGRTLSSDEVTHYQRIIVALADTIRVMGEIDEVVEAHGGWPLVGSVSAETKA